MSKSINTKTIKTITRLNYTHYSDNGARMGMHCVLQAELYNDNRLSSKT